GIRDDLVTGVQTCALPISPMIAELYATGRKAELQRLIVLASRGTLLVATPVLIVLLVAGRPILGLFGPAFATAWAPMAILSLGRSEERRVGDEGGGAGLAR